MKLSGFLSTLVGAALLSLVVANTLLPHYGKAPAQGFYRFEVKISSTTAGNVQTFYDTGRSFNEAESSRARVEANQAPALLSFPLVAESVRGIRFDPIDTEAIITLSNALIRRPDGSVLHEFSLADFTAANQIARTNIGASTLTIETIPGANDPYVYLQLGTSSLPLLVSWSDLLRPFVLQALPVFGVLVLLLVAWHFFGHGLRQWLKPRVARLFSWSGNHPKSAVALIALAAAVSSSYPVVFCGASFVSPNYGATLLYADYPTLPGSKAAEMIDAHGSDVGAIMWQQVPISMIQSRALLHDHELPLWNRYNSGGNVLLGQGQTMFGDPLHFGVILANGASWAWDLKYIAAKWLLGLGLGLVVLHATRHLAAALIVGFASIFVGFFVFRANHPAIFSFCYGPWVLYAWCHVVDALGRRRLFTALLGLIFANFALLTSGTAKEAYISLLTMNFTGAMMLLCATHPWREKLRRLGFATAAGVLFMLLAAPVWLTFYDSIKSSYSSYNATRAYQLQPSLALAFFDEILLRPFKESENVFNPSSNFLILLGVLAYLVNLRRLVVNRIALGVGLGSLLPVIFVFGFVPPHWIASWPILGNIHHIDNSFGIGLIHLFAVMAGFGFAISHERLGKREGLGDMALGALLLFALVLHYVALTQTVQQSTYSFLSWGQTVPHSYFVWGSLVLLLAALFGLTLLARRILAGRPLSMGLALSLLACVVLLLWRHGMQLHSQFPNYTLNAAPRANFSTPSPALRALTQNAHGEPGRVTGLGSNFFPGWNDAYLLEGINGPDALMNPFMRELQTAFQVERVWDWRLVVYPDTLPTSRAFLDLMNVRYYLDFRSDQGKVGAQLTPVKMADLDLYRSETAWPRAFFADRVSGYRTPEDFAEMVRAAGGRPLAAVQAGDDRMPRLPRGDQAGRQIVPATHYQLTNNTTSFEIQAPGPGLAVLSEAWLKGDFTVTINGVATEYFRVNHAFKGVVIPQAGAYRITFRFLPRNFALAVGLCGFALLMLAGAGYWAWRSPLIPAPAGSS